MNEKPENIWKKSWCSNLFVFSLLLAVGSATIIVGIGAACGLASNFARFGVAWVVLVLVLWLLIAFIHWLSCWRNFKRFLFGLACLVTLIALFYAEEDWRGRHDWEKFKREWEARGEHFEYTSIIPAPVPDDQNFAMAPIWIDSIKFEFGTNVARQWYGVALTDAERTNLTDRLSLSIYGTESLEPFPTNNGDWARGTLTDLKRWQNYYRELATKTNQFPVALQPQTAAQDVLLALGKYDAAAEELRAASRLPYSRFPIFPDADHPFDTLLPHLTLFKRCAMFLELRAIAELQNGQSQKAAADVMLAVNLGEKIRTEPFLISHLVRIAMLQRTLQPVYEGLANHQWTDAQLVELDSALAKLDFLADYERSMRGERACFISTLEYMRRSREIAVPDFNGWGNKMKLAWVVPSAFFYQNELVVAKIHQQCNLPMVDPERQIVSPTQVRSLAIKQQRELDRHVWPYKIFARLLLPAFDSVAKKFAYAQSSVDLARVAIALERCRLAHGEYPELLDALAPQFMAKIPHDIINGQPLKYHRKDNGQFVLYSVGWNETDDGGVVKTKVVGVTDRINRTPIMDISQGDWVWRYPAK